MRSLHKGTISALVMTMLVSSLIAFVIRPGITQASTRGSTAISPQRASNGPSLGICTVWNVVSSPNPPSTLDNLASAAVVSPYDAWAVGGSSPVGFINDENTLALHWNGRAWSTVPTPNTPIEGFTISALSGVTAIASNNVWAVGVSSTSMFFQALIEHWDGTNWTVVPGPNLQQNNGLAAVAAVSATDIWAVGWLAAGTLAEHWDGTRWSAVSMPDQGTGSISSLSSVVAIASNNVWAVGRVKGASATYNSTLIEHWNGSAWSTVRSPNVGTAGNQLYGITALGASNIWAVGNTYDNLSGTSQPLIEHWNGTSWSVVPTPALSAPDASFYAVAAVSSGNVWAAGYTTDNHFEQTLLEHWNGTSWTVATSPNPEGGADELYGIAAAPYGRYLVAVGSFGTPPQTLVLQNLQTVPIQGATRIARRNGPGSTILCP